MMKRHFAIYDEEMTKLDGYAFTAVFWADLAHTTGIDISGDDFFLIIKSGEADPDAKALVLKQTTDFTLSTESPSAVVNKFVVICSDTNMDISSGDYYRAIKWVPAGSEPHTFIKGTLRVGMTGIERSVEV